MPRYFQLDNLKQTFAEDWRIARSWKVLFLWIPKLLRQRLTFKSPSALPVPFFDFVVPHESIPPGAVAAFSTALKEAEELGFSSPVYQVVTTLRQDLTSTVATCRDQSGEVIARLMYVQPGAAPSVRPAAVFLQSWLSDGRLLITTSQRQHFNSPAYVVVNRRLGASLSELARIHRGALEALRVQSSPERILDDKAMGRFVDQSEESAMEHHLARGLFRELTAQEVAAESGETTAAAGTSVSARPMLPAAGAADAFENAVLFEIDKLQNKRGNWATAVVIALLSLIAFVGA